VAEVNTSVRAPLVLHNLVAALLHLSAAAALLTMRPLGALEAPLQLTLNGAPATPFAAVDLAAAAAVVALFIAAVRIAVLLPPARAWFHNGLRDGRHGVRWLEYSQTAGISVFLVAQINGIVEAGTLILVYAMGAGAVLLLWVHDRSHTAGGRGLLAFSVGTAIAIVPWGVVSLHHIVGIFAGPAPSLLVRAVTLALLLVAAAHWLNVWLDHRRQYPVGSSTRAGWPAPLAAERAHLALSLATSAVFVAFVAWAS
jgi:hypothetical protein